MMYGAYKSVRDSTSFNRPKKLIATSMINSVGKYASKYANAGAALCLVYSIVRRSTNFLFDEDMEDMSPETKHMCYGFFTGLIFKSTRGLKPALLSGVLMSSFCGGVVKLSNDRYIKVKLF